MKKFFFMLMLAVFLIPPHSAWAEEEDLSHQMPLTQADIDAYVYILPRLTPELTHDAARANQLMINAGIGRKRLIYVGAKVVIAQAMAIGAMTPSQLADHRVPLHMQPSPEEISLITTNLQSLALAQETARRAAAGITGPL